MSENDIGNALLRGENEIDLKALTERVLRRDRRRVWILGAACFVAWMLVVMLPWATTMPALGKIAKHIVELNTPPAGAVLTPPQQSERQTTLDIAQACKQATIATFLGSLSTMFVASLCTVLLVTTSRRATLRQVNARLAEISAQLKILAVKPG